MVLILLAAVLFSALVGKFLDVAAISVILVLNAVLGFVQEYRAEKAIKALNKLLVPRILVRKNGEKKEISSKDLVPGDIIFLEQGNRIPAYIRLLGTTNLKIDEASLTGESVPVEKKTEAIGEAPLPERKNMAYTGTLVTYGRGIGVVAATGERTEMGEIAHMITTAEKETPPLQKKIQSFSSRLAVLILIISGVITVTGILRGNLSWI